MGEALSLVVIDKLPFAAPDDPVLEALGERLRSEGGNPFMELALPLAVIALKQGAGRLIRDVNDRGALVLCDPRLRTVATAACSWTACRRCGGLRAPRTWWISSAAGR